MHRVGYKSGSVEERGTQKSTMSRYIVLLGLLAVMVTVYAQDNGRCDGDNESWNLCGHMGEPVCNDPPPNTILGPGIGPQCSKFTAGCRCDSGYFRDLENGSCVLLRDCQKNQNQDEQDSLKSAE